MKNRSISSPSSTDAACWRDEKYDYFRTSDGKVVRVRRDFEREAAEKKAERLRARVMFWNWAVFWLVRLLFAAGFVTLTVLIVLEIGG